MEAAVVDKIQELVRKNETVEVEGLTFSERNLRLVDLDFRPSPLKLFSLQGLVDYILSAAEVFEPSECFIHVVDETKVELKSEYSGVQARRTTYVEAALDPDLKVFPFDQFMDLETFIIKSKAMFQPDLDLNELIAMASKVTAVNETGLADDGVTQTVETRKGISGGLKETAFTKGIVSLRPFRTFREVQQPEGQFILRMKSGAEGKPPLVALFEADGGAWKTMALRNIRAYLESFNLGVKILA